MINTHKILLGLALVGATTIGFSPSASAKPKDRDVKEARKEVKKARKDVRKADTREERRDAREDLREEREDLREERRENRRDNGRRSYGRPTYGPGSPNYNRSDYNRPGYNRPNYNRPGYDRPRDSGSTRTLEGVVIEDTRGQDFVIRTTNGSTLRVVAANGEPSGLSRGDTVRVTGRYSSGSFNATNVDILNNR